MIRLQDITADNLEAVLNLQATVADDAFVDPVSYSFAEAWLDYAQFKLFAICNAQQVVGFTSLYVGDNSCQIINFLIDDRYQRQGYGRQGVAAVMAYIKQHYPVTVVSLPVHQHHTEALAFWSKMGFAPSQTIEDGYVFMRKQLND